ncbi:MAG TPA: Crp/Fnr family transcriptional regulator, partial [Paracoccaceae bacterium]|nr:Crp/Fnr family transcriptional regulator [Paracoccaceae bacterium]
QRLSCRSLRTDNVALDRGAKAAHIAAMSDTISQNEMLTSLRTGVPLFDGLPDEALQHAISLARRRKLDQGELLFRQGGAPEAFFLILAGRLKIGQTTQDGQQVIIRYLGPREIAGCVAVCGGMPYPATAEAVEATWLLEWTRTRIAELSERYPAIAISAMRIMSSRLTELQDRLRELHTDPVERRIAHALGRLVVQAGRRTGSGIEIDFPLTRRDLAEMTGTTLHTVSRTLSRWEADGIVGGGRQRVAILDPHALIRIADDRRAAE